MSEEKITCSNCGKQFPFKPDLAGKKVKCKCGNVFVVPNLLVAKELDLDLDLPDIHEIKPDSPPPPPPKKPAAPPPLPKADDDDAAAPNVCPNCYADLAPAAVICIQCGYNRKTKKKLSTAAATGDAEEESSSTPAADGDAAADKPAGAMQKLMGMFKKKPK